MIKLIYYIFKCSLLVHMSGLLDKNKSSSSLWPKTYLSYECPFKNWPSVKYYARDVRNSVSLNMSFLVIRIRDELVIKTINEYLFYFLTNNQLIAFKRCHSYARPDLGCNWTGVNQIFIITVSEGGHSWTFFTLIVVIKVPIIFVKSFIIFFHSVQKNWIQSTFREFFSIAIPRASLPTLQSCWFFLFFPHELE